MKPVIKQDALPSPAETAMFVQRKREVAGGLNWAAVSAGFVCPGAGQFLSGKKGSGMAFLGMFIIAVLIAFIPLGLQLLEAIRNVIDMSAAPASPMPWFAIGGGISLAIVVWIAAMIHAAFLKQPND